MRCKPWLLLLLAAVATVEARFADTQGFSGRHGPTCGSCHNADPIKHTSAATAHLEGLPEAWDAQTSYAVTVRVEGGPVASPIPGQPQGGFDLETDQGTLASGPNMQGLLRFPNANEATYTANGTLRREWALTWTAPNLSGPPRPVRFWLAVLSANGNHIMDGPDVTGQSGDRLATLVRTVQPSLAVRTTWGSQPIPSPTLDPLSSGGTSPWTVTGFVANFTQGAQWSMDGGPWIPATGHPRFLIQVATPSAGRHELHVRALFANRTSEPATLTFTVDDEGRVAAPASTPGLGAGAAALALALVLPRSKKRSHEVQR